jgi:tRNA_anti-like
MPKRTRDDDNDQDDDRPRPKKKNNLPLILGLVGGGLVLVVLLVCGGGYLLLSRAAKKAVIQADAQEQTRVAFGKEEPIAVPWLTIQDDWRQSAIAAEKKWKGKLVKIEFIVGGIAKSEKGNFYLTGQGGQFYVFVAKAEEASFAQVRRGDTITIVGRVDDPVRNPEFNEPFYDIYISGASLVSK